MPISCVPCRSSSVAHQIARDEALLRGAVLERLDQLGGAHRRAGQRRHGREERVVDAVEGIGRQRVGRQRADQHVLDPQRTAETGMHVPERVGVASDQPVERIGQRGVGGKAHRLGASCR